MKILSKNRLEPLLVTAVSIIARAAHLLFFLIIGNKYGASSSTDFVIYMLAPLTILSGVVSGAADTVVMPVFHKIDHPGNAKYIFIFFIKKIITFILPISIFFIIISSVIIQKYDLLIIIVLFSIPVFSGLTSLKIGILNASNRFRVAMIGPFFGSISAIIFLFFTPVNKYYLGSSFLVFEIGKFICLYFFKNITTNSISLRTEHGDQLIKWGLHNAKWQFLGSFVLSLVYPVDIWFASMLATGSVTFVEYANKLWNIVPLFFVGHISIIYSIFSKATAKGINSINIHRIAVQYLFFGVIASLAIFSVSDFIIKMLYGFGKMNMQQQAELSALLKSYLIGAGPYVGGLVYVRAMSAAGRTDLLFTVASIGLLCNIIFDALFIRIAGLNGIGLATSAVYLFNFIWLSYFHHKRNSIILIKNDSQMS